LLADGQVSRALAAWSITSNATIATATALWGILATLTSARIAIAAAGVLLLATPALLPRERRAPAPEPHPGTEAAAHDKSTIPAAS
jgi:hypothetical protein